MELKDKLKAARKARGISQKELAAAIFVSRSAVAKWENGLGLPSEDSLAALAAYFGVDADTLRTDAPEEVILAKNRRLHRIGSIFWTVFTAFLVGLTILLYISVVSDTYGLTSKMAAGRVFVDNPCIHNGDVDIYYGTMDTVITLEGVDEAHYDTLVTFRPVRRTVIGWRVYEEDYAYRRVYYGGEEIGRIYSIQGKHGVYNIVRLTLAGTPLPMDLHLFDRVTANGETARAEHNAYFVTEAVPRGTLYLGDVAVSLGEEVILR